MIDLTMLLDDLLTLSGVKVGTYERGIVTQFYE